MIQNPYASPQAYGMDAGPLGSRSADSAEFSVECDCGAVIPVSVPQAGGSASCRCGRIIRVPRLSQLRVAKGLAAHETNIRDTIARMIRDGELPWGRTCAVTGMPTEDVMWFDVQCEQSYVKSERRVGMTLLVVSFLLPFGIFLRFLGSSLLNEDPQRLGHDIAIGIPLRVCSTAQSGIRRWATQRKLRRLLGTVPVFTELFQNHPGARIKAK